MTANYEYISNFKSYNCIHKNLKQFYKSKIDKISYFNIQKRKIAYKPFHKPDLNVENLLQTSPFYNDIIT